MTGSGAPLLLITTEDAFLSKMATMLSSFRAYFCQSDPGYCRIVAA
jgi:hypothetical protein